MFGSFSLDTSSLMGGAPAIHVRRPSLALSDDNPRIERVKWNVLTVARRFPNADIDWYRDRYIKKFGDEMGKAEGERRFFAENEPEDISIIPGNMLLGNGAAALWQYALGNGSSSANNALGSGPTYFNNSQTYLYIGDAGITAGTGTISVTNGGTAVTFGTSQSGLVGKYLVMTGDSTGGLYLVVSGSGTSWTIATPYGGTTLSASAAGWSYFQSESHSQTGLSGTTNTAHQIMDSTFPSNPTSAQFNSITGATAASPSVLTISGGDIATNDIVQVFEIQGMSGVNGMWVANPASSTSVTLLGSTGTGSFLSGFGIVTKRTVAKFQATFGPGVGQWGTGWWEWSIVNGTGGNQIFLNRKCFNGGTKTSGTTSLQVAIGIG